MTATEEIVEQEQTEFEQAQQRRRSETQEPEQEPEPEPGDEEETDDDQPEQPEQLFDRSQYDREGMAISKIDGQQVDRISIKFAGKIMLNRSEEADVALFNKLALGRDVELRVAGRVQRASGAGATGRDGDLDVIVGQKTLKIGTVWVLEPENL
jgi:hypothetical protein